MSMKNVQELEKQKKAILFIDEIHNVVGAGSSEGATLYSTLSPCVECAKLIMQSGIDRILFRDGFNK